MRQGVRDIELPAEFRLEAVELTGSVSKSGEAPTCQDTQESQPLLSADLSHNPTAST